MFERIRQHFRRDRRHQSAGRGDSARMQALPFYQHCMPAASERLKAINGRILISDRYRFVYVRIPKCANSTIVLALGLQELGHDEAYWDALEPEERRRFFSQTLKKETFRHPSDLQQDEADQVVAEYRRVMFVRNPFSRVASAYLDKIASGKYRERLDLPADFDFPTFCDFLADGGLQRNIHWMPQTAITPFAIDSFDFIGRFESLDHDLARLTRHIHGREQPVITLASHATHAGERLDELYGERERRMIAELYADDFTAFGYDADELPG